MARAAAGTPNVPRRPLWGTTGDGPGPDVLLTPLLSGAGRPGCRRAEARSPHGGTAALHRSTVMRNSK